VVYPKRTKFKKIFKGRISKNEYKVTKLSFGRIGLKVLKSSRIKDVQLDAIRKSILKRLEKKSKIWIKIFPHCCVTAKPVEVRMGKGKGVFSYWCAPVKAGRVILELQQKSAFKGYEILKITANKLGLPLALVLR
jgi:large subunit ribosomal protein L16